MNHFPRLFLKGGKNSLGFYSRSKPKKIFVFVHGFKGDALMTWTFFSSMMIEDPEFIDADILFYGYNSWNGQMRDQGSDLLEFLNYHVSYLPGNFYDDKRGQDYRKIVIVAHSQGAIIARFALLKSIRDKLEWRGLVKLVLFAPAHNGSRIQNLLMLVLPAIGKLIGGIIMYNLVVLDELRPQSVALNGLKEEVKLYIGTDEEDILSAYIIEAYGDKVVHNEPFCYDLYYPKGPVNEVSHTSVCKPAYDYMLPIDIIKTV